MNNMNFNIVLRNLIKNKVLSIVGIISLTISFVICILTFQYLRYELSYEKFYNNNENIYRVRCSFSVDDQLKEYASSCPAIGPVLEFDFPEIEHCVRMVRSPESVIKYEENKFEEDKVFFAESTFLDVFSLNILKKNSDLLLDDPNMAIISSSMAKKYFGNLDPLGKIIEISNSAFETNYYRIQGVFEDIPQNTHMRFNVLLSYNTLISSIEGREADVAWNRFHYHTYVLLNKGVDSDKLELRINKEIREHYGNECDFNRGNLTFYLQPINQIHLRSHYIEEYEINGNILNFYLLFAISLFILVCAISNFINLYSINLVKREKHFIIHKFSGANRFQLFKLVILEIGLVNLFSLLLAGIIIGIFGKYFYQYLGIQGDIQNIDFMFFIEIIFVFVLNIIVACIFPLIQILSLKVNANQIQNKVNNKRNFLSRKALVVLQYTVVVFYIICLLIVNKQINYLNNEDLGVNIKDRLVIKGMPYGLKYYNKFQVFKNELIKKPEIKGIGCSSNIPGGLVRKALSVHYGENREALLSFIEVDQDYLSIMDMKFLAGRNFSNDLDKEESVILTEKSCRLLGFETPNDAIGEIIRFKDFVSKIIGVTTDYYQYSNKINPEPIVFIFFDGTTDYYTVKMESGKTDKFIKNTKEKWNELFTNEPFDYFSLEEYYKRHFKGEEVFFKTFILFTFLNIFILFLGIMGMTILNMEERKREIVIRQVIGAEMMNILKLNLSEFVLYLIIASLIAWPLTYIVSNKWLQEFAKTAHIGFLVYIVSSLFVFLLTLLIIVCNTINFLKTHPINSLKGD